MNPRRFLLRAAQLLLVISGCILAIAWYYYQKDYAGHFRERKGELRNFELQPAGGDSAFQKAWLRIESSSGLVVDCGLLTPVRGQRHPAVILLGGKATGKYAIDYALDIEEVIIVAVDYPYEPRPSYTVPEFLVDIPAMRTALLNMVPSVMLLVDYLATRRDVDTSRIVVLGYSFGAPLVPAIMAHDKRPVYAAMVFGGGDLYGLIRHNVRRTESPLVAEFVAGLGALLLNPLEPLRYAKRISPVPLLMINGSKDEQIPRMNTELFYEAALEPKKIIWLESSHVRKENVELTRTIIRSLREELARAGLVKTRKDLMVSIVF